MSESANLRTVIQEEFLKSAVDSVHFFKKYAKIQHPMKGKILFNLYPFQEDTVRLFKEHRFNIVLKSRQMGISTLCAGHCLHQMIFNEDFKILVIATKQDVAKNLVQKVQIMWEFLPAWMKQGLTIVNNNKLSLVFSNGSEIKAVSSSPDAARSEALSLLVLDEFAFVDCAEEIWTSAQSTLATGGSCIMLSTPNGIGNLFHQTWQHAVEGVAEEGLDKFNPILLPWHLHPDRDQKWRDNQDSLLGKRLASQECLDGYVEVTVREKYSGKVKKISLNNLYEELSETLICKICGYSAKQLHQHLKAVHNGMTSDEYRQIFGNEEQMQCNFNPISKSIDVNLSNIVKNSYSKIEERLNKITKLFDKDLTRDILIEGDYYKNFLGRTKYRTLICENPQLYKSIIEHTNILNLFFKKITLNDKIKFIVEFNYDVSKIKCECGKKFSFNQYCRSCVPNYPSFGYFVRKYGIDNAEVEYEKDKITRNFNDKGRLNLQWFKDNYGDEYYLEKYQEHYKNKFDPRDVAYSKVSQKLFREIQDSISDLKYFATEQGEYKIYLKSSEILESGQSVYFLDLFYKNKNIEFDGGYYKKTDEYKNTRDTILKNRGIQVLRIEEMDYCKNKELVIQRCVEFLNDN